MPQPTVSNLTANNFLQGHKDLFRLTVFWNTVHPGGDGEVIRFSLCDREHNSGWKLIVAWHLQRLTYSVGLHTPAGPHRPKFYNLPKQCQAMKQETHQPVAGILYLNDGLPPVWLQVHGYCLLFL